MMMSLFFQQLRSTQRCITPASSLSHTLHPYVWWSWRTSRYVTSCGFNRCVFEWDISSYRLIFLINDLNIFWRVSARDICTYSINRFLETHQSCRGSGGPCSAQLRIRGWGRPWGWGPAQSVLRSNRCELGARRLACWWWSSLFSPCATCRSACSMSWKGN